MSDSTKPSGKSSRFRATILGSLIGGFCWAVSGVLLGYFVMAVVFSVMHFSSQGYLPVSGSARQDAWNVAKVFGKLGILPGLLVGASMVRSIYSARIPGEPRFWTLVRYSGFYVGVLVTNIGATLRLLRNRFSSGDYFLDREFMNANGLGVLIIWTEAVSGGLIWSSASSTIQTGTVDPSSVAAIGVGILNLVGCGYLIIRGLFYD